MFLVRYRLQLLAVFIVLFSGCSKSDKDDECAGVSAPEVTVDTDIQAGEDLYLTASTVEGAEYYLWSGPNNFSSEEQTPVIANAQPVNAGVYTVQVGVTGGCVVTASSSTVNISMPAAACNPANNTASISGVSSINVYSATGAASGSSYFITANGTGGDIEIEFPGTTRPTPGLYNIQPLGGSFLAGDVRLRLVSQSSNWPSHEGKVHFEINSSGKFVATFCNVPVTGQTVVFSTTSSGKITED